MPNKELTDTAQKRLIQELEEVQKELHELGATHDGGLEVALDEGFADAAQSTSERAKVLSLVENLQMRLHNIEDALKKIEDDKYGFCERCGDEISSERLDAIPSVRLCITCAQKA